MALTLAGQARQLAVQALLPGLECLSPAFEKTSKEFETSADGEPLCRPSSAEENRATRRIHHERYFPCNPSILLAIQPVRLRLNVLLPYQGKTPAGPHHPQRRKSMTH